MILANLAKAVREQNWFAVAIEFVIVIAGVALGFQIQGWNAERQERAAEAELLGRLHAEFSTNLARIDERTFYLSILSSGEELFSQITEARDRGSETMTVSGSTLRGFLFAPTFEADTPVLDGLISRGQLEIIEDRDIQNVLATWERELRDYTAFAERARRYSDELLLPALSCRGDVGDILMAADTEGLDDPAHPVHVQIRIDAELRGIVAGRYSAARSAQRKFDILRTAAIAVIDEIERQIP